MLTKLTEDVRRRVSQRLKLEKKNHLYSVWPTWAPKQGVGEIRCDMWTGPCSCGDFHRDGR
jgi:hypothetical protein